MSLETLSFKWDSLIKERVRLSSEKQTYQTYLSSKDEVNEILSQLAAKAQSSAISLYSELLTKLVTDVLGKPQQVVLESRKIRDKLHLNIHVVEGGHVIDILEGKGGSVCNIIAVGMRIITLIQSPYRRFLFLDEPDCWLSPDLVEGFVSILKQLCTDVGLQVVYISHHSERVIGDGVKNVHLSTIDETLLAEIKSLGVEQSGFISEETQLANDDFGKAWLSGHGLKSITLQSFMSHERTHIELDEDITLLTGNNDIGKSSVFRALKALSDNNPKEGYIKHNAEVASVTVTLEGNVYVTWSFSKKKSVLPCYTVTAGGEEEIFECKAGEIPSVIYDVLNFGTIGEFDLHFGQQNDPLFILHPSVKGYDRAKFLSLSDDFDLILQMIEEHKHRTTECRSFIKVITSQLESVNEQLKVLKPLPLIQELHDTCQLQSPISEKVDKAQKWLTSVESQDKQSGVLSLLKQLNNVSNALTSTLSDELSTFLSDIDDVRSEDISVLSELHASIQSPLCGHELCSVISTLHSQRKLFETKVLRILHRYSENVYLAEDLNNLIAVLDETLSGICSECGQEINVH